MKNKRLRYILSFLAILVVEVIIALFVRDRFIRPYGGDVLVTVLLCCLIRIFFPNSTSFWLKSMPLWVFLFAATVEGLQYFNYVTLLGLGDIGFFRILLGTSFSWVDIVCYGIGCIAFFAAEEFSYKYKNRAAR